MRFSREQAGERATTRSLVGRIVFGTTMLIAAALPARAEAAVQPAAVTDTTRIENPIHFRKTVLFTPDYLARVAEAASRKRTEEAAAARRLEVEKFARTYNISQQLARTIHDTAVSEGIDPELAFRLVRVESRFNPRARGPAGALGLAQLMPSTARALDRSLRTEAQIMEPATNLRLGFSYLRRLIERYDGDVRLGLLAYNRGEGTVDRVLRSGRDPENGYSRKVLGTRNNTYSGLGLIDR